MTNGHPKGCQCGRCRQCHEDCCPCEPCCVKPNEQKCNCRPSMKAQVLLPRIIGSGREWMRRWCVQLTVQGLPNCAKPPFTLVHVQQGGGPPRWEQVHESCNRQVIYHLMIPLDVCVRDGCGCQYTGTSCVEMDACLQLNCRVEECWRHQLIVLPCIRLACTPPCSQNTCFEATLETMVELYLVRWEPFGCGACEKPACPDLPLYPPPCNPCRFG